LLRASKEVPKTFLLAAVRWAGGRSERTIRGASRRAGCQHGTVVAAPVARVDGRVVRPAVSFVRRFPVRDEPGAWHAWPRGHRGLAGLHSLVRPVGARGLVFPDGFAGAGRAGTIVFH